MTCARQRVSIFQHRHLAQLSSSGSVKFVFECILKRSRLSLFASDCKWKLERKNWNKCTVEEKIVRNGFQYDVRVVAHKYENWRSYSQFSKLILRFVELESNHCNIESNYLILWFIERKFKNKKWQCTWE